MSTEILAGTAKIRSTITPQGMRKNGEYISKDSSAKAQLIVLQENSGMHLVAPSGQRLAILLTRNALRDEKLLRL
jgi:hypothetical protein